MGEIEMMGCTVSLREATLDDAPFTWTIRQDDSKTAFIHKVGGSIEDQERWLARQIADPADFFFVVSDCDSGSPIGTISVYDIKGDEAESGRFLMLGNQPQTSEAFILSVKFAFEQLGIKRLHSHIFLDNLASIAIGERFGRRMGVAVNDEFGLDEAHYIFTPDTFDGEASKILRLIQRFARR